MVRQSDWETKEQESETPVGIDLLLVGYVAWAHLFVYHMELGIPPVKDLGAWHQDKGKGLGMSWHEVV